MAWYNIYRPAKFEDVIGQTLVKSVLQNSLAQNKIKHGYLLSGPKGTGKTTLARIFASSVNDLAQNPEAKLDIIELDAASNTGVDNIRQLIDSAQTPPFAGKYKVYIIDEVHMLSKSAMNALLKILEEPPEYLIFILATTNPEKLLPTVLSRLTKLTLTSHTEKDIADRLSFIAKDQKMSIDPESLKLIAKRAGGGQRDAINLLETLHSYNLEKYTLAETTKLLGLLPTESLHNVCVSLLNKDLKSLKEDLQIVEQSGIDGESFLGQLLEFLLDLSFEGEGDLDALIIPVAKILDLKLPINTVVSSVALVQAKLNESNYAPNGILQKKNLADNVSILKAEFRQNSVNNSDLPKIETIKNVEIHNNKNAVNVQEPDEFESFEESVDFFENTNNQPTPENYSIEPLDENVDNSSLPPHIEPVSNSFDSIQNEDNSISAVFPDPDLSTDLSLADSDSIAPTHKTPDSNIQFSKQQLQLITKEPNCPTILKMIVLDIEIVSQDLSQTDPKIQFSISSPLFLPQLNSLKTKIFIKSYLENILQIPNLKLDFSLRQNNNDKSKEKSKSTGRISNFETQNQLTESRNLQQNLSGQKSNNVLNSNQEVPKLNSKLNTQTSSKPISNEQTSKSKSEPTNQIFYSIYKGFPSETQGDVSNIPVWNKTFPAPTKPIETENNHHDLEDMFDFE